MQVKHCPACGVAGGDSWTQDSFGTFRVVVDANKARKVARDGSKFLYDDSQDSLIRMLWPDRVTDYVQVDAERERTLLHTISCPFTFCNAHVYTRAAHAGTAFTCTLPIQQHACHSMRNASALTSATPPPNNNSLPKLRAGRRAEDLEARKKFEVSVHGDRLVNPSATNPGMAAGRYANASNSRSRSERLGTRLRPPPLAQELPVLDLSDIPRDMRRVPPAHVRPVLLMPLQHATCAEMRAWGARSGLMDPEATLPALLKPYLQLPLERITVRVRTSPLHCTLCVLSTAWRVYREYSASFRQAVTCALVVIHSG